jgi:hypothetical protein
MPSHGGKVKRVLKKNFDALMYLTYAPSSRSFTPVRLCVRGLVLGYVEVPLKNRVMNEGFNDNTSV